MIVFCMERVKLFIWNEEARSQKSGVIMKPFMYAVTGMGGAAARRSVILCEGLLLAGLSLLRILTSDS